MKFKGITVIVVALLLGISFAGAFAGSRENDQDSRPDSHRANWEKVHQNYAKANNQECAMCHKPIFCIDCHQRRDEITERVHKRNWKFLHSVEVRANAKQCDSCHRQKFCTDCHQNPR